MNKYNLNFITDEDLKKHVKETISKYRFEIDLKRFNKNLVDPIKLTFDSKVYGKNLNELIEGEVIRQIDKSNSNNIGYFNQNIFNYIGENEWVVPREGFDIVNENSHIYTELKNKHNTMNSSSSQKTYMKMQNKILRDSNATCMLVEVIAKNSQNIAWSISLDGESIVNENIRRVSIDKFYEIVTGDSLAFRNLISILPTVIDDMLKENPNIYMRSTVFEELKKLSPNILKSLYILSFGKYEGFDNFDFV